MAYAAGLSASSLRVRIGSIHLGHGLVAFACLRGVRPIHVGHSAGPTAERVQ